MKKIIFTIFILITTCISAFAEEQPLLGNLSKHYNEKTEYNNIIKNSVIYQINSLFWVKKLYKFANKYDHIYYLNILDKTYTCYNNNCYDFNSFQYNKLTKTSYINMIIDLMDWNAHETYPSPYGDGYVSHLIFQAKLHKDKLSVKCIGFVVGKIVVDYKDGIASSAQYNIIAIHKGKPAVIKNIKDFEDTFYKWIDINALTHLLKTW